MCPCEDTCSQPAYMPSHTPSAPPMSMGAHCGLARGATSRRNQHEDLYMHQATQQPCALSYVDTCRPHSLPEALIYPLFCYFPCALAPGKNYGKGGQSHHPLLFFSLSFLVSGLSCWCSRCLFTYSCPTLQPTATSFPLPGSFTHAVLLLHAHVDTCTHTC